MRTKVTPHDTVAYLRMYEAPWWPAWEEMTLQERRAFTRVGRAEREREEEERERAIAQETVLMAEEWLQRKR